MPLNVCWGNGLEALADDLFRRMGETRAASPAGVFAARDCVVVPNRIQQAWLRHRFLYDSPRSSVPHVLANCDFPLLGFFINDWLYRMDLPGDASARPDPEQHPFSVKSMRWRIFHVLRGGELHDDFAPLDRYVADPSGRSRDDRKCFKLAGRLAKLFDDYANLRPEMLFDWEKGRHPPANPELAWEPALWRRLVHGRENETYLAAFRRMDRKLATAGLPQCYRRIFVFAPSMLPGVHLAFFRALGTVLPVDMYLFNPAREDWFDRASIPTLARNGISLDRPDDPLELFDAQHPLLSAFARGARDLVAGAIDLTGGQVDERFSDPPSSSVLGRLQQTIVRCDASLDPTPMPSDGSIQLHLCHGKMREVEILRDLLLRAFEDLPGLQPRHVQVQVADMNAYAPYVEAVFSAGSGGGASNTIPFVLADRVAAGESPAGEAFRQLMMLADGRFAASDVLGLLRCDGVARKFGFEPGDVDSAIGWLNQAGVRWGRDPRHREQSSQALFESQTSWRHGLDRLLLGYALGQEPILDFPSDCVPCDGVEGGNAVLLGRLARFYEELTAFADFGQAAHPPEAWADRLDALVDDFFASDNDTYRDVAMLKSAIRLLRTSVAAAQFDGNLPLAVVRDFLSGHLGEIEGGSNLVENAVVFSALRPGSSAPRRVQCLLGMGDGLFPRTDGRPAYDLTRDARKMGDRSPTVEDRMAFLEAILNARDRFIACYPAFSEEDNKPACESVALRELVEYLDRRFGAQSYDRMFHRLQSFHPAYFGERSHLFSYSSGSCNAARALLAQNARGAAPPSPPPKPVPSLSLDELIDFFANPARYYVERILGATPTPTRETMPDDTETFEPDHLAQYRLRNQVVETLGTPDESARLERLRRESVANGSLPLGASGRKWFAELVEALRPLLAESLPPLGSLRNALDALASAPPREWVATLDVDGASVVLSGRRSVLPGDVLFSFRCAKPKAQNRLAAWLTHLLALSAGLPATSLAAQGKEAGKLELVVFSPHVPNPREILAGYLRIFLRHRDPPPAYTPSAALAFVETLAGDVANREKAMAAAQSTWLSGYQSHGDDQDVFYRQAFAGTSPLEPESDFVDMAARVMGPMVANQSKGDAHA